MKKVTIKQFSHAEVDAEKEPFGFLKIPLGHSLIRAEGENLEVSDGYHTFDELYKHRIALYIALCKTLKCDADHNGVWRSKLHSDDSEYEGWFILGIGKEIGKQITYHLPMDRWEETEFAETLEKAPPYDGHSSEDVLKRLTKI